MNILITGGSGFLGRRLANTLLERGTLRGASIDTLWLADRFAPPASLLADKRVRALTGPLLETLATFDAPLDAVFHLAAAVSAECEADFDLGMQANIDTTRALLQACRARRNAPLFMFASSVAVFGSDPAVHMPAVIDDATLPTPQSSYGIQKFVCEQLVADCTRKGFVDGRPLRLMTVAVRPGPPNAAASGFISAIVREPLAGQAAVCPVDPSTEVAISSPATTVAHIVAACEASREAFGGRTALNLPALSTPVQGLLDALARAAGADALKHVRFGHDQRIADIVLRWPARFQSRRAAALGLRADADCDALVSQYLNDSGAA